MLTYVGAPFILAPILLAAFKATIGRCTTKPINWFSTSIRGN